MSLKQRLASEAVLVGTFLKTPSPMVCEVLARTPLDLVCIDAEHAPFDRGDIDACLLALRAGNMANLVRLPARREEHVLNALDCGADGVLAPHVITPRDAEALVASAHFGAGRGFAGSTRAADYTGRAMADHIAKSRDTTTVVAQIEDADALGQLDALFEVTGVDAWFIGRADLTVSLGADSAKSPEVLDAVEAICRKGAEAGQVIGMFTGDLGEIAHWRSLGARLFLLGSDHGFMLSGADALCRQVREGTEA